jgi:hypothetical protein
MFAALRPAARGSWNLRSDGLLGDPAHSRNRSARGAGCAAGSTCSGSSWAERIKTATIGLGIGLTLAVLLTRAVSSALFGVVQFDLITTTLLTLALASVATLAAYIPARRAAKVDPMVALRYE